MSGQSAIAQAWGRGEAQDAAKAMFGNQALHRAAAALGGSHPRALDYIRQAPVIVLSAAVGMTGLRAGSATQAFAGPPMRLMCDRGDRLRDVMRHYGCAYQLRRLAPSVLHPVRWPAIYHLGQLPPSTLAQAVPEKRTQQDVWLRALTGWTERCRDRCQNAWFQFDWAAVALRETARGDEHQAGDLADMLMEAAKPTPRAGAVFDPKWTLAQARAAMERWHRAIGRMRAEQSAANGLGVGFSDPVAYAPFPDEPISVNGFTFVPLRSCEDLWVEGVAMRHCVAIYSQDLVYGLARIFSIQQDGRRIATAEWRHGERDPDDHVSHFRLRQLKGPCNAHPPKAVVEAASAFAAGLRSASGKPEGLRAAFPNVGATFSGERAA